MQGTWLGSSDPKQCFSNFLYVIQVFFSSNIHLVYMSFMVGLILVIMRDTCEFYARDEEYIAMSHLPHF